MRQFGDRKIKVKKSELLDKIKANREQHIKDFDAAVIAYKEEALKQLKKQTDRVEKGALDATLDLVTPVDSRVEYDKLILMFEMEVEDIVELDQQEFNQYVHDETAFAIVAKFSNSTYLINNE